jgi:pimeloyl-ACP methyl ester carboxylesterase
MRAALLDPSRVGRLVLVGSAGRWDDAPRPGLLRDLLFSPPVLAWLEGVPPLASALRAAMSAEAFSGQPEPDWWLPQLDANFAALHTLHSWLREEAHFRWDGPDTADIPQPILVIQGDADRLVPLQVGRTLYSRAPDGQILVVEGGSHMLPITHAALLADRIAAFVGAR